MMEDTRERSFKRVVLAVDGLLLLLAMLGAWSLHQLLRGAIDFLKAPPAFRAYLSLAYLLLPLWLLLIAALGLHRVAERRFSKAQLVIALLKLHALALAGLALVVFLTQAVLNRSLVAMLFACSFALTLGFHLALGAWLAFHHGSGLGRPRWLLVGERPEEIQTLIREAGRLAYPPQIIGLLAEGEEGFPPELARLGRPADLPRVLHDEAVDQVFLLPPWNLAEVAADALAACEALGLPAYLWVNPSDAIHTQPRLVAVADRPFIAFSPTPKRPEALAVKHGLDLILAASALLVTWPLLLLIALAILATMGRPILFRQERIGLSGRRFRLLKFRTMVLGAEAIRDELEGHNEMGGPVFKMRRDPRVTPLGRLLRQTSLDELPQLFNVLTGAMSLVGPRPLPVSEQQQIHGAARRRLTMRPGLSGLWQVSGRSDLSFAEWMKLDLLYVDTWSLGLDLRILLRTVPVLLGGRGAR